MHYCGLKGAQYATGLGVYMHLVRYGGVFIKELQRVVKPC